MSVELARFSAGPSQTAIFLQREGHRPDPRALALAVLGTALLFALIVFLPRSGRPAEADRVVIVALPVEVIQQETKVPPSTTEGRKPASTARDDPAPAPRASLPVSDFAIRPVPAVELGPVVLPQIPLRDLAPVVTEGVVAGAEGAGGGASDGNGLGEKGSGRGRKLAASWAPEMSFAKLNSYFPKAAIPARTGGVAVLRCRVVRRNRVRNCSLVSENPAGLGFGQAALDAEAILRVQVHDQNGRKVHNEWILFEAVFRLPERAEAQG